MCLTPVSASFVIRVSVLSFMRGIMGSIRTVVGMLFVIRVFMVFRRSDGGGACGSKSLPMLSSSVVMVKETMEGMLLKMSRSLATRLDFVIIWILQSC